VWLSFATDSPTVIGAPTRPSVVRRFTDGQTFRTGEPQTFDGADNVLTGDVVTIALLERRTVIVTYSVDMFAFGDMAAFLKVNNRDCGAYGPAALSSEDSNHTTTLRWIVAADEVVVGRNRFEVCVSGTGSFDLRTLTVERLN
jgi:hypothetical protein